MNAEHKALAKYLEGVFDKKLDQKLNQRLKSQSKDLFTYMERRFNEIDEEFKRVYKRFDVIDSKFVDVNRRIDNLIDHVDKKNDPQDEEMESHE